MRYKSYKRTLNQVMRIAERNYYQTSLDDNKHNLRKSWKILKMVIGKNSISLPSTKFKINDSTLEDENIIVDEFNRFFY